MFLISHDEYKQMDKKKLASLVKAAKCLCYGIQLFSYDQNYHDPSKFSKLQTSQQYL